MRSELITACSPSGYAQYGKAGIASMREHWPIPVTVYADAPMVIAGASVRLTTEIPGWSALQAQLPSVNPSGSQPENYRWNAKKFAVKCAVWAHAAMHCEADALVWLDADTVTKASVPVGLAADLLGEADVAYLGRGAMHPETGCVVFRIPQALYLIHACLAAYQTGAFRSWKDGWTDCHVLRWALGCTGAKGRDLTSHQYAGEWDSKVDAFALSPLGDFVTHLKGGLKRQAVPA